MRLESAPVPVTRNRGSDLSRLSTTGLGILKILRFRDRDTFLLSVHVVLDLVQAFGAVLLPAQVSAIAQITGTRGNTIRVKASILVQRDEVRSVCSAEDVAAVTTVMATHEDTEGGATGRRVTVGRGRISLKGKVSTYV